MISRRDVIEQQNRELAPYQGRPPLDEVLAQQRAPRQTTPAAGVGLAEHDPERGGVLLPPTYGRKILEPRR